MENYFEILSGKRAYFIGDSLFGAHGIGKENSWVNRGSPIFEIWHRRVGK